MNILSIVLYGILGMVLAFAGINVMDKPLEFCMIMGLVVAIDVSTMMRYS